MESLSPQDTKLLSEVLVNKKRKDINFDSWLKKHECIILTINEFIISCFNDDLKNKYFAAKYPSCLPDDYFTYTASHGTQPWITTTTTTTSSQTTNNLGNITLNQPQYTQPYYSYYKSGSIEEEKNLKVILMPKEFAKRVLVLDSFKSD